jgi:hypothetical protein
MGEEINSSRKREEFLLIDFGDQERSWVLRRAPAMLAMEIQFVGLGFMLEGRLYACNEGHMFVRDIFYWGNGSRALRGMLWELLE